MKISALDPILFGVAERGWVSDRLRREPVK
jgi:hypothetical protein